jgi:alcohol dehydrogenase
LEAVKKWSKDIGIPSGLIELGVLEEVITTLTNNCMKILRLLISNPRPVTQMDLEEIYERTMENR